MCGIRSSTFSFTSLNSCEHSYKSQAITVLLDKYLVVFDECSNTPEGGLERHKQIRGLLRNIEEDLHAIYNPLSLCWRGSVREYVTNDRFNPLTSAWIRIIPRGYRVRQPSLSKHGTVYVLESVVSGRSVVDCRLRQEWDTAVTRRDGSALSQSATMRFASKNSI